ncbi:chondroitinase-B domain-containing protein [uncultured Draconibacterium sp.]|uniref:chondroitinase-B domain-containing protein n=1 Tax=uncultured Draconibacterium sp. TaxID=1573823 RepID=UPI0029C654E2|nr:chondroitinase-B domain-containing protein [uncultured Draconibacterium sp.]
MMHTTKLIPILLGFILFACTTQVEVNTVQVQDKNELKQAIEEVQAGDEIVLANGIWEDVTIELAGNGTKENPIVLRAETPGEVYIEGQSSLKYGGDFWVVRDLYFRNGFTPNNAVVEFRLNNKVANNCVFTNCVIDNFNQLQRDRPDHWVEFWGRQNELSNCNIIGKSNSGPTVRVFLKGNESIRNHHRIINNHFGPRPRKGGPHGETLQIGDSGTSMSPSNTLVADNLFDRCNGEVEVISSKTNYNEFRNNVFYKCEGSLVMRHGNYCWIDGNYFIGDDNSENIGGIRIVNTGHWVVNNYFYNLKGNNFRAPLAVMNGIPKSPLNRYNQVTDVVVAYNTWIDCKSPWHFGVGANLSQAEVLPPSEIRSARPVRTVVANNIVYTSENVSVPVIAYDKIDGVTYKSNVINSKEMAYAKQNTFDYCDFTMNKIADYIYAPSSQVCDVETYNGFDFETITTDILGNSRTESNRVGAMCDVPLVNPEILDKTKYGANWFASEKPKAESKILKVSAEDGNLQAKIKEASSGDIIKLAAGEYSIDAPLDIDKEITLKSATEDAEIKIVYKGEKNTPLFQMNPNGKLKVQNILLEGNGDNFAFASLQKNMSALYDVEAKDCRIEKFNYVLKAYKESFSDSITFVECEILNCDNGIELSEETDDNGDYNVEFLTIDNCRFNKVKSNVIDYYRGGYDESTIGGNLLVTNSTFTNCGGREENGILLNTRGIVNVNIADNSFKNNPVKLVALLWGAKNNSHSNNEIRNSGKIVVEENLKLKLMY